MVAGGRLSLLAPKEPHDPPSRNLAEPTREVIAHGHSYLIDRLDVGIPTTPVVWLADAEDIPYPNSQ